MKQKITIEPDAKTVEKLRKAKEMSRKKFNDFVSLGKVMDAMCDMTDLNELVNNIKKEG